MAATEEWGIDLSRELPKPLTDDFVRAADVVITMGLRGCLPDLSDGTDHDLQSDGCIRIATLNDPTTSWPSPNASPDRSQARTPEAAARRSWPCNNLG